MDFDTSTKLRSCTSSLLYVSLYLIFGWVYRGHKLNKQNELNQMQLSPSTREQFRYWTRKQKIWILGLAVSLSIGHSYCVFCDPELEVFGVRLANYWDLVLFRCFDLNNNDKLARAIVMALFMCSVLYMGPIYQEIYNGSLRKKLMKLELTRFRWDQFTKIVVIPIYEETIFRILANHNINANRTNNSFFILYSSFTYTLARCGQTYLKNKSSGSSLLVEIINSFSLGSYLAFVLVCVQQPISVIIIHGFFRFMGKPNVKELMHGDFQDQKTIKTAKFYLYGVVAFILICLFVL